MVAKEIARFGDEAVIKIAQLLHTHDYLCDLGLQLPQLTLEEKTYFILWDWMDDNILSASAERRLAQYVQMMLAEIVSSTFAWSDSDEGYEVGSGNEGSERERYSSGEEGDSSEVEDEDKSGGSEDNTSITNGLGVKMRVVKDEKYTIFYQQEA